ncbi:MAG: Bax inhibitor-1/YccA family protein [Sphaerochaetaceae bacterium]|jgi:FtsH-binding integral membrane protein
MVDKRTSILQSVELREQSILKNVYMWMTLGLTATAVVAYAVASSPALMSLFLGSTFGFMFIIIAQFGLVIYLSSRLQHMSSTSAIVAFIGYAILTGITFSSLFYVYSGQSISQAFFTAALLFAGMSLYGMTTKRALHSIGQYLIMGLWGVIVISIINMFIKSSALELGISFLGVILFLGLTAWDTQKIKQLNDSYGSEMDEHTYIKLSIMGALMLYLDLINIFLYLLRIFGRQRD